MSTRGETVCARAIGFFGLTPDIIAVVGDALARERRTMGFTVQSILRRIPIVVAPTIGLMGSLLFVLMVDGVTAG